MVPNGRSAEAITADGAGTVAVPGGRIVGGGYGGVTVSRKIHLVEALPAVVTLAAVLVAAEA